MKRLIHHWTNGLLLGHITFDSYTRYCISIHTLAQIHKTERPDSFCYLRKWLLKAATSATRLQDSLTFDNTCLYSHAQHTTRGCRFSNLISLKSNQRWFPRQLCNQLKSNPQNISLGLSPQSESSSYFFRATLWVIRVNDTRRETAITLPACSPHQQPPKPLLVSPAPTSLAATATSQWLEFNQLSSKQRGGPKQEWLSGDFAKQEHGQISNYESEARQTVLTLL